MRRFLAGALALAFLAAVATPITGETPGRDALVVPLIAHPPTLDPHQQYEWVGILVAINMFDSLVHRNARLEYEPSLARSWKALNDTVWEFTLREGVQFHNGSILSAEDVKYSFERVLEPRNRSPHYDRLRAIKMVRVVSPDTVHLVTERPFPLLLEQLVFFPIVPRQHVERVGDEAFGEAAVVGTGPFKLGEIVGGQHIRLEAFDGHWRGKPGFRALTFRVIPDLDSQIAELKAGRVDLVRSVPAALLPDLWTHPLITISSAPILRTHYVQLDMRAAPFTRKAARQAANYAIDRDALIRTTLAGAGRVVPTVVHPDVFGYDASVPAYPYDPQRARKLLAEAGYPKGVEITLHSAFVESRPTFDTIIQMLTDVGFKTTARTWEPGAAWTTFVQGQGHATHGYYGSWGYHSVFDAEAILRPLYHRGQGGWVGKWYTRVGGLDQLIDQGRWTLDPTLRQRAYTQIQQLLREESPSIFLFHELDTLATSRRVEYAARGDQWLWLFDARPLP